MTHLDLLLTDKDVTNPKPDPEILLKAMEHFGSQKAESIVIGDTGKDITAGQRAEIDTGLVLHELNRKYYDFVALKNTNPTKVFSNLSEVLQHLLK